MGVSDVGGVRSTPTTRVTTTAAAAETAPAATTAPAASMAADEASIPSATLEYWAKNYKSATPENIQNIKDAYQQACGRQPTENEIEIALWRMDLRSPEYALETIRTSTEAAVRKYGSQVDSLIEQAAKELRDAGTIDEEAYNNLVNNPERKSWYSDMFMEGKKSNDIKDRIKSRLEKILSKAPTEVEVKPRDGVAEPTKPPHDDPKPSGVSETPATDRPPETTQPEKTITVGGSGMGGGSKTSFNVTPGELAAMYDLLKSHPLMTLQEMQKELKEMYGIDTDIKGNTLVSKDGRAMIADTNGNGILDINDIDFNKAIDQVKQEFGIDITKYGRLDRLQALAQSKGLDDVLAIFERSRKAAEEAQKEADKARQEGHAIDAATQSKLNSGRNEIDQQLSKAIEDNLGYNVSGDDADGKFVGKGEDIEKPLHDHEADTANFDGQGKYVDHTDDRIKEEVKDDPFAGIEGDKHADPSSKV